MEKYLTDIGFLEEEEEDILLISVLIFQYNMLNINAEWQYSGGWGLILTAMTIIVQDKTHVLIFKEEEEEGVMWRDRLLEMFLSRTKISNWFLCLPPSHPGLFVIDLLIDGLRYNNDKVGRRSRA